MTATELNELIFNKLGTHAYIDSTMNALRFYYHGNTYRVTTDLNVEKVDSACLVTDSDARQLEKLLRGEQWDGTGLPPVGTECEYEDSNGRWVHVEIRYLSKWVIVMRSKENNIGNGVDIAKDLVMDKLCRFRPLRTERNKAINQMLSTVTNYNNTSVIHAAGQIYDAIVAGKIDGLCKVG